MKQENGFCVVECPQCGNSTRSLCSPYILDKPLDKGGAMTIQEVMRMAGKVEEIRRRAWEPWRAIRQGDNIIFEYVDFNATDWEVVENKPVIEVGDIVRLEGIKWDGVLVARDENNDRVCVTYGSGYFNVDYFRKLTLIRKGPKVHTFEGACFYFNGDYLNLTGLKVGNETGVKEGKTYTMTLKEEKS